MAEENITPPAASPSPAPAPVVSAPAPKEKTFLAYAPLAILAYVISYFLLAPVNFFGGAFGNALLLGLLVVAAITMALSFAFFRTESIKNRIWKSVVATIFIGIVAVLIGLGLCFVLLAGYR